MVLCSTFSSLFAAIHNVPILVGTFLAVLWVEVDHPQLIQHFSIFNMLVTLFKYMYCHILHVHVCEYVLQIDFYKINALSFVIFLISAG